MMRSCLKIDQLQVNIFGDDSEPHSVFTLPLTSSKVVATDYKTATVSSKQVIQCLSQLQLFSRTLGT